MHTMRIPINLANRGTPHPTNQPATYPKDFQRAPPNCQTACGTRLDQLLPRRAVGCEDDGGASSHVEDGVVVLEARGGVRRQVRPDEGCVCACVIACDDSGRWQKRVWFSMLVDAPRKTARSTAAGMPIRKRVGGSTPPPPSSAALASAILLCRCRMDQIAPKRHAGSRQITNQGGGIASRRSNRRLRSTSSDIHSFLIDSDTARAIRMRQRYWQRNTQMQMQGI